MTPAELKEARHALGLSISEFAALCRVTTRSVRRWEDGTRDIPGPVLTIIAMIEAGTPVGPFIHRA